MERETRGVTSKAVLVRLGAVAALVACIVAFAVAVQAQKDSLDEGKLEAEDAEWAAAERACIEDPDCSYDKFQARQRIEYDCDCRDSAAATRSFLLTFVGSFFAVVALACFVFGPRWRPKEASQ